MLTVVLAGCSFWNGLLLHLHMIFIGRYVDVVMATQTSVQQLEISQTSAEVQQMYSVPV